MKHRVLILIPAALVTQANAAAQQFDAEGGASTFRRPVNGSGDAADAPTHYVAGVNAAEDTFAALPALKAQLPGSDFWEYDLETDPGFPRRKLEELGLNFSTDNPNPGDE